MGHGFNSAPRSVHATNKLQVCAKTGQVLTCVPIATPPVLSSPLIKQMLVKHRTEDFARRFAGTGRHSGQATFTLPRRERRNTIRAIAKGDLNFLRTKLQGEKLDPVKEGYLPPSAYRDRDFIEAMTQGNALGQRNSAAAHA